MSNFLPSTANEQANVYEKSIAGIDLTENYSLGKVASSILNEDPKLLLFTLSRYKFVSKMFAGKQRILEIGCQEGFGALLIDHSLTKYVGLDFYLPHINSAITRFSHKSNFHFYHHDVLSGPHSDEQFDAIFSLDVLEHIPPEAEHAFFLTSLKYLRESEGPLIIGMPSLESQKYASERSKIGHVNCKSKAELKRVCEKYFRNVFTFSMNDEVMHTGFDQMSHYVFALCVTPHAQ